LFSELVSFYGASFGAVPIFWLLEDRLPLG
jgi:hypothetical protein